MTELFCFPTLGFHACGLQHEKLSHGYQKTPFSENTEQGSEPYLWEGTFELRSKGHVPKQRRRCFKERKRPRGWACDRGNRRRSRGDQLETRESQAGPGLSAGAFVCGRGRACVCRFYKAGIKPKLSHSLSFLT